MIFSFILKAISNLLGFIISFINVPTMNLVGFVEFVSLLKTASFFFPADIMISFVSMAVFMVTFSIVWAIIEWVYKKIPGVS